MSRASDTFTLFLPKSAYLREFQPILNCQSSFTKNLGKRTFFFAQGSPGKGTFFLKAFKLGLSAFKIWPGLFKTGSN
ncbi:TPA: hypothetical protein DCP13_03110 [Candidatus Azambacteria bacterium]|nr:hypothetical protein [Candidatus Azambacteria bacterium]